MKKGFTLIELLVVATIIATLIGAGSVSYIKATQLSRDSKRKTDLEQIRQALETYRSENGVYPTTAQTTSVLATTYINAVPTDPKTGYLYAYTSASSTTYVLCSGLESSTAVVAGCGSCGTGITCQHKVTQP